MATRVEEEYFPPYLTGLPSDENGKDKDENASNMYVIGLQSGGDAGGRKERKPRFTFAESLVMQKTPTNDGRECSVVQNMDELIYEEGPSPFAYNASGDSSNLRRRITNTTEEEDDAPPPRSSLSDAALPTFATHSKPVSRPPMYMESSFAPSAEDHWGFEKQYWITIYGFSFSMKHLVLAQFKKIGQVVNVMNSGGGNWVHLRYKDREDAEKALGYDGKRICKGVMVGVKKCMPGDLEGAEEGVVSEVHTPSKGSAGSRNLEVHPEDSDIMLPTPRRQDVCSRVLNYLFNW